MLKNAKILKEPHAYRRYGSTYNAAILNSFNLEMQLKDTESAINHKLIDLLAVLKGFKFVASLILEL